MIRASWFFMVFVFVSSAYAQDIRIDGTIKSSVSLKYVPFQKAGPKSKQLSLLNFELSPKAQSTLLMRVQQELEEEDASTALSVTSTQLGMNYVPVLDQGSFGTCVTFATSAAIDAVLDRGDYISQTCSLQLSRYLAQEAYGNDAWNGTTARAALNQMELFGIISKATQRQIGCGGLTRYPRNESDVPASGMTELAFHASSVNIAPKQVTWSPVLEFSETANPQTDMDQILRDVKTALIAGDRLILGVLLPGAVIYQTSGAEGGYHHDNDTWILTPSIATLIDSSNTDFPGHELIITGFDDHAIAVDYSNGSIHQGLLTLRNSWGPYAGDWGNYYMSYDYFKALAMEIYRIRPAAEFNIDPA